MSRKLTQKIFNEEMFASILLLSFSETAASQPFVETSLRELREYGYDVDEANKDKMIERFIKRLEKLSGYEYE